MDYPIDKPLKRSFPFYMFWPHLVLATVYTTASNMPHFFDFWQNASEQDGFLVPLTHSSTTVTAVETFGWGLPLVAFFFFHTVVIGMALNWSFSFSTRMFRSHPYRAMAASYILLILMTWPLLLFWHFTVEMQLIDIYLRMANVDNVDIFVSIFKRESSSIIMLLCGGEALRVAIYHKRIEGAFLSKCKKQVGSYDVTS